MSLPSGRGHAVVHGAAGTQVELAGVQLEARRAHHFFSCSTSVQALHTLSRGASKTRLITNGLPEAAPHLFFSKRQ